MRFILPTLLLGCLSLISGKVLSELVGRSRSDETVLSFMNEPGAFHASKDAYTSGDVHMSLMDRMTAAVGDMLAVRASGLDDHLDLDPITEYTPCIDGFSGTNPNATYACKNMDMYSFMPHSQMGSEALIGNDLWGWSHGDREFGLVGQRDGTAFVEIAGDGQIVYLGRLPTQSGLSIWRDIKVIRNYAYIGSEAWGHGIQIFDLTKLLDRELSKQPKTFSIKTDLTALYDKLPLGASHNIVAHESKNLIAAVGSVPRNHSCAGGLIFVDVTDPSNPKSNGCASKDGYTHDAQCLTYYGPHTEFNGTDVCYAYNENTLTIYNITTPSEPSIISATYYYGVSYSHQGWVLDEKDQRYLLLDDELDEIFSRGWAVNNNTVTYIWDIQDLTNPKLTGHFLSPTKAIDHNLYVVDGFAYEANYCSGLRVVDVSSIPQDPTGRGCHEVAFFDVHPEDDAIGGVIEFGGAWSSYPYFKSKFILVNSMDRGLFVLKYNGL